MDRRDSAQVIQVSTFRDGLFVAVCVDILDTLILFFHQSLKINANTAAAFTAS
jgi:hypothetical protein